MGTVMGWGEWAGHDATSLADLVRRRQVTPAELAAQAVAAIAKVDPAIGAVVEVFEDVVADLGGSFSAEHGIGQSKLGTMRRRKDPVALATMRAIKAALDPGGILNPGKVIPPSD